MRGTLISYNEEDNKGRIRGEDGAVLAIYFNAFREGIQTGADIEFTPKVSGKGFPYAKFEHVIEAAETLPAAGEAAPGAVAIPADEDPFAEYMTVSACNNMISRVFQNTTEFRRVLVKGEVTNFSGRSNGHYYFDIKDDSSIIKCTLFAGVAESELHFELANGRAVAIVGNFEYYEPHGKSNIRVQRIEDIGAGNARLALLALTERLRAEGIFDDEHKKAIPEHPRNVGLVTSSHGQAKKDFNKIRKERNIYLPVFHYDCNVQGRNAVESIVQGIRELDGMGLDVIVVTRGGGSDEDLKYYNDEAIVRAIYEARTPIISAVGHEGNWFLSDRAADDRAATPTDAAKMVFQDIMKDVRRVEQIRGEMGRSIATHISRRQLSLREQRALVEKNSPKNRLRVNFDRLKFERAALDKNIKAVYAGKKHRYEILSGQLPERMRSVYESKKHRYDMVSAQLPTLMQRVFQGKKYRFDVLLTQLHGLSPTAKLVNGFGYIASAGKPVVSIGQVTAGDSITVTVHDGVISADVTSTENKETK